MKLDSECTKDILLSIEEHSNYKTKVIYPDHMMSLRDKHRDMKIRYHIVQAHKSGLIELIKTDDTYRMYISDLTPSGHEYLKKLQSDKLWSKIKKLLLHISSESLSQTIQIGASFLRDIITSFFP